MKVIFRTDASIDIGNGHVMRCLTLADAFMTRNADCQFICRDHDGNLIEFIRSKGYIVHALTRDKLTVDAYEPVSCHAKLQMLGVTQEQDIEDCIPILAAQQPDWLVVDHYALDANWERGITEHCCKLMVIDDLADRSHVCDMLIDQTFGRDEMDYSTLVPTECRVLCGSRYVLLRPEFTELRSYSLKRRAQPNLRKLLITMGGVDKDNVTGQVLQDLNSCQLPAGCQLTIVMGANAPWVDVVRKQAQRMQCSTRVLVGVTNMAQLMAESDLAIGAAGATSWERCCMGLPTLLLVLAENQRGIAQALEEAGAARLIQLSQRLAKHLRKLLFILTEDPNQLLAMSKCAAHVVEGGGVHAILRQMES